MPRASRYLVEGFTYHLTHRCHDGHFRLRLKRERETYREWLRIGAKRYHVSLYAYCITSSHTHVVAHVDDREAVAGMMSLAAGAVAQNFNKRKKHEGSVWEHPYQCTMIEDGMHLINCLRYVDLNMVRAGVVGHPSHWRWCGYDELTGKRTRFRLIDMDRLLQSLDIDDMTQFSRLYEDSIHEQIEKKNLLREPLWTESLAIGNGDFVEKAKAVFGRQRRFFYQELADANNNTWAIKETQAPYNINFEEKPCV